MTSRRSSVTTMWKVILLLAFMASLSIVYCDGGCGGDPNAKPGCGVNCGRTCATYKNPNVACPYICIVGGCDCKDGYVFDDNVKKCVLPQKCGGMTPPSHKCPGQNEFFDTCISGCSNQTCETIGKVFHCPIQPAVCRKGCRCKPGFYRNANNVCVSKSECPPICGVNEMYNGCVNGGCGHRNCSQLGKPILCIDPAPGSCIKGCSCVNGYLRADNGTCVPQDQCPAPGCGGDPNAEKGCGFNCGRTCSSYMIKNISLLCPRIQCKPDRCDCKDGYVFDNNLKKCVLPKQCTPICRLNEKYDSCTNGGCGHRNCSQLRQPILCIDPAPGACIKGCRCTDGYLRAANGTCIPQDQCPAPVSCGGDPNAHPGCGVNCGRTCRTYKSMPRACPLYCKTDGCDCKKGYVLDENIKKCVLPIHCSTTSN